MLKGISHLCVNRTTTTEVSFQPITTCRLSIHLTYETCLYHIRQAFSPPQHVLTSGTVLPQQHHLSFPASILHPPHPHCPHSCQMKFTPHQTSTPSAKANTKPSSCPPHRLSTQPRVNPLEPSLIHGMLPNYVSSSPAAPPPANDLHSP